MSRIEELRAAREQRVMLNSEVGLPCAECGFHSEGLSDDLEQAEAALTEALDGWEKAEAELTQLREALESERYHAGYNIHDDLDREEHQQDTPDCPACAALTQENNDE